MTDARKEKVVAEYIDAVRDAIELSIDKTTTREQWRVLASGVLRYWLEAVYDEGSGATKDLETCMRLLRAQVANLRSQVKEVD